MKGKVLVIGAGGFIGQAVVAALPRSVKPIGLDLMPAPQHMAGIDWLTGSIADLSLIASVAAGCQAVVFLANASLPGSSQASMTREASSHVEATLAVAEACRDVGVGLFLFASSGGTVYGYDAPEGGLREDAACWPLSGYGVSKLSIEHYLRLIGRLGKMRTLSLRLANPYGEGQRALRAQGVVAAAMQHATTGTVMPIWGDGSVERDFLHISDVARAFVLALDYEGEAPAINIGSGRSVPISEIVARTREATGRPLEVAYEPERSIDVHRNALSIELARRDLGWAPETGLEEGLRRTAQWWLEK